MGKRITLTVYREYWRPDADDSTEGEWETETIKRAVVANRAEAEQVAPVMLAAHSGHTDRTGQPTFAGVEAQEETEDSHGWFPSGAMCWWREGDPDHADGWHRG